MKILIIVKQFLRPRQSGAHGTCHAYHTLNTPLVMKTIFCLWCNISRGPVLWKKV